MADSNGKLDELGSFYLGRRHDLATGETRAEPLLYDSKDLTTHAVCVGMTGSGKTGLCLSLLEEAALDGVPAIAIDPKGDLGNLLLAFPNLAPSDFRPWVDESEAARRQMSVDDFAANQAELWRNGLAKWDEGPERIRKFCDAVERVIYTPGSSAGIPVTVLRSFQAPPKALLDDTDALSERVSAATSGLLALLGIEADPVRSREHIFLSNVLDATWRAGRDLDLRELINQIQRPPITKLGVVDLESFYPASERYKLAMSLNNLLASPAFASWLEGTPLDIQKILYTPEGKPRLAIFSIAHLDDAQRMFFVTILLNEILAWVRTQPGTSSLRALLYMDEVFGYFPPLGNPPAKRPMLTLLKQARAYGLGCVLATQNPVDLDYKGLSNAGTWFLGRLQTERDKARVIEGLEGASTQAGATFNRQQMEATLAALGNRVFLMNSVHRDAPEVFQTRWAMSYLAGPLTRGQIKTLMDPVRAEFDPRGAAAVGSKDGEKADQSASGAARDGAGHRLVLPAGVREKFIAVSKRVPDGYTLQYRPGLLGKGRVHFVRKSSSVDLWRDCFALQPLRETPPDDVWEGAEVFPQEPSTDAEPDSTAAFAELPGELAREKSYGAYTRQLKDHLYRHETLKLLTCELLSETARAGESEEAFRALLTPLLASKLKETREKLEKTYEKNLAANEEIIRQKQAEVSTKWWQFFTRIANVLWVALDTILSAFKINMPGRRRSLGTAMGSVAGGRGSHASAKLALEKAMSEKSRIVKEHEENVRKLVEQYSLSNLKLEPIELKPQKSDIDVSGVWLAWLPWRVSAEGVAEEAYALPDAVKS